ncbi:HAMP domain-containing sensor histidine kinase [Streptomyces sp. NBC_00388]|uniref:HAMP domain-containing sensor histidine kinase n=1 Tax=Streptomyces sp. NBC_00388 TaxID=2975735 RepID=UPI002E20E4B6
MTGHGDRTGSRRAPSHRLGARWRRRRPLRTRLALTASAAVALVALGVCAAAFFVQRYEIYHQLDLNLIQSAALAGGGREQPGVVEGQCRYLASPACSQIVPADPAADPREPYLLPVSRPVREVAAGRRAPYVSNITLEGRPTRMLTTTFGHREAVQVALRADPVETSVRRTAQLLAAVGGGGVLIAAALGYWVSRTGLAPVARLTRAAERIAATRDPRHRIELPPGPVTREDEVTRLATTFNTMLGELEQSVTAQRRLVADASHELRTPLTALRTNAELLSRADRLTEAQRDRAAGALTRQIHEVTTLVNDLIELARDEEPVPLVESVRLVPLAEHAVAAARGHWPALVFTVRTAGDPVLNGVPARLSRLIANLLSNAAKFSGAGGEIEIDVGAAELTVRDHGPGISPADLPYVFDRFYRARAARALPGSGLGLAMARQIARAHGAELTAEQAPGGGALFRLSLP